MNCEPWLNLKKFQASAVILLRLLSHFLRRLNGYLLIILRLVAPRKRNEDIMLRYPELRGPGAGRQPPAGH